MNRHVAILMLSLALLFWVGECAECTDVEAATAESIWASAAATSACSPYVTQTNPVYVNAPCTATDCVAVVEDVAVDLPDCTISGINNKIETQNALTACNGGDTEDAGSLMVATDAPTATAITDSSTVSPSTSTASSSALTPASTTSSESCTPTEIKNMWNLHVATAKSEECTPDSVVNGDSIEIISSCGTNCTETIRGLANEMPNCFYDYEYINKKQDVLDKLDGCEEGATSVSIALLPDTGVEFWSSSGSNILVASSSTSGMGQLNSGDSPSDNTLDSSKAEIGSSISPPRGDKMNLWFALLPGVVAVFTS